MSTKLKPSTSNVLKMPCWTRAENCANCNSGGHSSTNFSDVSLQFMVFKCPMTNLETSEAVKPPEEEAIVESVLGADLNLFCLLISAAAPAANLVYSANLSRDHQNITQRNNPEKKSRNLLVM